jgi:hypothetical protein
MYVYSPQYIILVSMGDVWKDSCFKQTGMPGGTNRLVQLLVNLLEIEDEEVFPCDNKVLLEDVLHGLPNDDAWLQLVNN